MMRTRELTDQEIQNIEKSVFFGAGYHIVRDFIGKSEALGIRDELLRNVSCFKKISPEGNHRLFHYPCSPYVYPDWLSKLYEQAMLLKLKIANSQDFYLEYCFNRNVAPDDFQEVLAAMKRHTWSCFYWYMNGESHARHIDRYGELAMFVIFSELGRDYDGGGLVVWEDDSVNRGTLLDTQYKIGDLVVFDQARLEHEVKPIIKSDHQIERLQYYIPTIPYGCIDKLITFEGYESEPVQTIDPSLLVSQADAESAMSSPVHYSRLNYFRDWNW